MGLKLWPWISSLFACFVSNCIHHLHLCWQRDIIYFLSSCVVSICFAGVVLQVYPNIPAWPGRNLLENGEHRSYFALKTSRGTMEFECQKEEDHQLWTESISFLLYISSQRLLKWWSLICVCASSKFLILQSMPHRFSPSQLSLASGAHYRGIGGPVFFFLVFFWKLFSLL